MRFRGEHRDLVLLGELEGLRARLGFVMDSKSTFIVEKTPELKSTDVLRPDMISGLCAILTRGNCFVGSLARYTDFSRERRLPRMGRVCPKVAACSTQTLRNAKYQTSWTGSASSV